MSLLAFRFVSNKLNTMKNNLSESDYRLKIKDLQIFDEGNNYINVFRYYFAYFKTIPNQKCIEEIDAKALRNFIITKIITMNDGTELSAHIN